MKVAISTDGDFVSAHFGRCPHFTFVDIEGGKLVEKQVLANPGHSPGFIPQFLHEKGAEIIIAGGMGMRATGFFEQLGIKTIVGISGKIDEVIEQLIKGTLRGGQSLCQPGSGKGYGIEKTECDHPGENKESKTMKICVTAQADNLDAQVDPRFGRCQYFIIAETESSEFEAIKNPNVEAMGGAGIQSGQLVAGKDVQAVLTGNVGPNAFQTLRAAGLQVITGLSGSVKDVIEKYKKGELKPTQDPSVGPKFGMPGK